MASKFGTSTRARSLDIILDSPFAVFYGDAAEAAPVAVSGVLVLNNSDHMNVRGVKIKIEGKWKVGWTIHPGASNGSSSSTQLVRDKGVLLSEEKQFIPASSSSIGVTSTTHRIAPGRHEWRFEFMLDPKLPESIEGLAGNYVVYNLSAEIDRGYMSKSLLVRKHLRVIRTLSRDMTETVPFPYSNEDTWADKIKYHIYIPSRYYAFGTSIPVQFTLMPLRKGVRIGKIKMEVVERVSLQTDQTNESSQTTTMQDKTVAKMDQPCPQVASQRLIEESSGLADESYHFEAVLPLQRSLNSCRQSVSTDHIKVFHNLKIYVNIHNPDGHVSQLCLRNLIHLYISPQMSINNDQVITPSRDLGDPITGAEQQAPDAPPVYGTHLMDQLYEGIDISGFNSGMATPAHYLSRPSSIENLASRLRAALPAAGHGSESDSSRSSSIVVSQAEQLQTRLTALHDLGLSTPEIAAGSSTPRSHSPAPEDRQTRSGLQSGLSSARASGFFTHQRRRSNTSPKPAIEQHSGQATPPYARIESGTDLSSMHPELSVPGNDLSRIPSYNTAVRTPYGARSPTLEGLPESELPTYDYVVAHTNAANSPSFPPTPPSDSDATGFPFTRPQPRASNKSSPDPERRGSNPQSPPNASRSGSIEEGISRRSSGMLGPGSLSGFLHGIGRRRGSQ